MAKDDDYGFYGSGLSGYIHYTQGVKEASGSHGNKPVQSNSGCLSSVLSIIGALLLFYIALSW